MGFVPDPAMMAETCDGTEIVRVLKSGRWRWMWTSLLRRPRIEIYSGSGAIAFQPPFDKPPIVVSLATFVGDQMVVALPSAVTQAGCTLAVKRSRGTLALSTGPFETAPASVAASVLVIG